MRKKAVNDELNEEIEQMRLKSERRCNIQRALMNIHVL